MYKMHSFLHCNDVCTEWHGKSCQLFYLAVLTEIGFLKVDILKSYSIQLFNTILNNTM